MSAISGTVSGILNANAQRDASEKNAQNVAATNALNYQMYQQSRGSTGHAVLPTYFGDFEQNLGDKLSGDFNQITKQNPLSSYQQTVSNLKPLQAGADATAAGIFNGGTQAQMEASFAPVKAARVAFTRQSAIDSLNKTLGEIGAAQGARGYTGDSFGDRMMKLAANKQMSTDIAGANLQNLQDERTIADSALQLKLSNLSLPGQMANQDLALQNAAGNAYESNVNGALQPMTFLRAGGAQPFQNENLPTVNPTMSAFGAAAGSANGVGNAALSYWMQQQYANSLKGAAGNPAATGGGGYTYDPAAVDTMMNGPAYGVGADAALSDYAAGGGDAAMASLFG
jgi:hypothetical protein